MAGRGRRFAFHGAFGSKVAAKRKERQVGGFVRRVKVGGDTRYLVMTGRRKGRR